MPPTKHMTGDIFRGNLLDGFFNLAGALTGQGILLVGMITEAVVTPLLSDRDLALQNVRYVLDAAGNLHEDFQWPPDGFVVTRARQVLARRSTSSRRSGRRGLDLGRGCRRHRRRRLRPTKRPPDTGRGLAWRKAREYYARIRDPRRAVNDGLP